jgi:anti-anti-sigma factor
VYDRGDRGRSERVETLACEDGSGLTARRTTGYGCTRVALQGSVDETTAPWLAELLQRSGQERSVEILVLDVRGVTFFSSAGLNCLEQVGSRAEQQRTRISIWDPPPFLRRVLKAGGLASSILIEPPEAR